MKTRHPRFKDDRTRAAIRALRGAIRALACLVLAVALLAAPRADVAAASADCAADDATCFDELAPDAAWESAIGLPQIPHRYSGEGVTVASIDTGVVPNPDLGARLLARVDLTSERDGIDRFGHGTHIAGLIAGDGTTSLEAFEGAAPETSLVSVKVAGWDGATDVSTIIAALQWVVSNRDRYGIRVVNLSWGTDAFGGTGADPLDLAVERAVRAGLLVVVSAGNAGPAGGTIAKPGDDPLALTVGAADTGATIASADDAIASFSSRGPTPDGLGKPDLVAPGVAMVSDRAPGSTIDTFRPAARVGTALFKGSGTSQAAAVVSGVAARMLEARPALTPGQLKAALLDTAGGPLAGPGAGAGLVNAAAAVAAVVPPKDGPVPALREADAGVDGSTGTGALQASRGSATVYRDLDGDGAADPVTGELDVLGRPWSAAEYAAEAWGPSTWPASPWAALVTETRGSDPVASGAGGAAPLVAWDPTYWGARSVSSAGWDAKSWGAKSWGAKSWGTALWP
jgi:serine protease AprX